MVVHLQHKKLKGYTVGFVIIPTLLTHLWQMTMLISNKIKYLKL